MYRALWFAVAYAVLAAAFVVLTLEAVWTMAIPPALCALPLLVAGTGRAAGVRPVLWLSLILLAVFVLLGVASVGPLFLPSVIALAVAIPVAGSAQRSSRPVTSPAREMHHG